MAKVLYPEYTKRNSKTSQNSIIRKVNLKSFECSKRLEHFAKYMPISNTHMT
jgi:hypothetical protein